MPEMIGHFSGGDNLTIPGDLFVLSVKPAVTSMLWVRVFCHRLIASGNIIISAIIIRLGRPYSDGIILNNNF